MTWAVVFVEKSNQALSVLRENLTTLGDDARERSHVIRGDAWEPDPIRPWGEDEEVAPDVVFFDPPYKMVGEDPAKSVWRAQRIAERLAPGGVMVFHFQDGHLDADDFDREVELRRWGRSCVAFLEQEGERPERAPRTRRAAADDDDDDFVEDDDTLASDVEDADDFDAADGGADDAGDDAEDDGVEIADDDWRL